MKIPRDLAGRIRLLERAHGDRRLRKFLSPEAASAFGAFPLGTEEETLVVAVPRWARLELYALLGRALRRPVRPVPMEGELVLSFIARTYLEDTFPNFHTFPDPDFVKEENLPLLVTGKVEPLPPPALAVPADSCLLLDLDLRSRLENLDRHEGDSRVHAGGLEIPFGRDGAAVSVFGGALPDGVRALVKLSTSYEGMEHRHGFEAVRIEALPYVLHPTELQILGADGSGRTLFWVFDAPRAVQPGEDARLACTYHFLNFGNRYRRSLALRVRGNEVVPRGALEIQDGPSRWTLSDFDRWIGAAD